MLDVVCVNWRNYQGRGQTYVDCLRRGVERNLTLPHRFTCLTEKELGTSLKGWWVKMLLSEPGRFAGDVLYLDLDVIITSSIDHLVNLAATDRSKLWMREDFSYPYCRPRQDLDPDTRRLLGGPGCCNSSVMLWHADALAPVWSEWQSRSAQLMAERHGDQNVISPIMWPDRIGLLPERSIRSYKYGMVRDELGCAPIVVFHGNPKPHELKDAWLSEHWQ